MREYKVLKPYEIGYLRRHGNRGQFNKSVDALVYIFHIQHVGYVSVVTSPIIIEPDHIRFFFEETPEKAVATVIKQMMHQFRGDIGCALFELPHQDYLELRNVAVEVTAESGMIAALDECGRTGKKYEDYNHPVLVLKKVKMVVGPKAQNPRDFSKLPPDAFGALSSLKLA